MNNLYLFPEAANYTGGYGIVVTNDYDRLNIDATDMVVWYSLSNDNNIRIRSADYWIKRPEKFDFNRIYNIIQGKHGAEVINKSLDFLRGKKYDTVFCGDVLFYRAVRQLYPDQNITVRFHNCYARIWERSQILNISLDFKFKYIDLYYFRILENNIFRDKNVSKIFISEEDNAYYQLMTGRTDGFVWPVAVNEQKTKSDVITGNKLVWMGGVESHKKKSMQWFIESVFPVIKSEIPDVEFHIWGNRTKQFDNPSCGVFGYGFYNGNDFPFKNSALYVNPDIIGGGVKVKLATYFENGLKFISTPFGFEGYNKNLVDNKSCYVVDTNDFADAIIHILKRNFWLKR